MEEDEELDNKLGMGEAPFEEQKEREIPPLPPPTADITGVEYIGCTEVVWITDMGAAVEGGTVGVVNKCELAEGPEKSR